LIEKCGIGIDLNVQVEEEQSIMPGLSADLYNRCRSTLLRCSEFDSNASLRSVFVTDELHPFRSGLPEAASKNERVNVCLDHLLPKQLSDGRPVLPLFLAALRVRYQEGDALHDELNALQREVDGWLSVQTNVENVETKCLTWLKGDQSKLMILRYLLTEAGKVPLPPLGTTSTATIGKVEAIVGDRTDALNEIEAFILLSAVCLPHLLRLYDEPIEKSIGVEQVQQLTGVGGEGSSTFGYPQLVSAGQVQKLARRLDQEILAPQGIGDVLINVASEVSAVANARIGFEAGALEYSPCYLQGMRINLGLLGALLHLADSINLDQFVDPELPKSLKEAVWRERYPWWRQAYVRSVSIEAQRIQLHIRLPKKHKTKYAPILVTPLYEELQRLIDAYDPILFEVGINLNLRPACVTVGDGVPAIPDDEWQRLKRGIELEQARRSEDQLQQDVIRTQRLRDLLIETDVSQAEQMTAEERFAEAAEALARAARQLAKAGQTYQARDYATRAAQQYLNAGNQLSAARQYLAAAEVWLYNRTTPELAARPLEQAQRIAFELDEPALQVGVLRAEAWLAFGTLRDPDAQRAWDRIRELMPRIEDEKERAELLRSCSLQQATLGMVWEELDAARETLETALAACPAAAIKERLELLQGLLLISAECGDWETADRAYQEAQQQLVGMEEPEWTGLLAMHYAASLARRGALPEAYDKYREALVQLTGHVDVYTLSLVYQNMQYMLQRNGALFFSGFEQHEARRVDLFYITKVDDVGYIYQTRATADFAAGDNRSAMQHIRLALAHYWREGNWAGIERAYQTVAMLRASIDEPVEALMAAIRASDRKAVERYAEALRDTGDARQLSEVVEALIKARPAACEQQAAAKALGILADIIPTVLLESTLNQLIMLLQGSDGDDQRVAVRRHSAEALRHLVVQLDLEQTSRLIRVALEQLQRQQFWTITEELLKLLNECFIQKHPQVERSLYSQVAKALTNFAGDDHLRKTAQAAAVHLARTAPIEVRQQIIDSLKDQADEFETMIQLAFLKEPVSRDQLNDAIESILRAINPQPVSNGQVTKIGFSGVSPRAINEFNEILPAHLYDRVIDGLLEAIINEDNILSTRSSAIWALSELPTEALAERADEVAEYLMWGADDESLPRSETVSWELRSQTDPLSLFRANMGNIAQVRQSSLHALGRLYSQLGPENQERASNYLVAASRDRDPVVRQGAAMALRGIEGPVKQQQRLLLALVALLHDADPKPCTWACAASGHLIVSGLSDLFTEDLVDRLIHLAEASPIVEVRTGVAVGLRMAVQNGRLNESIQQRVVKALEKLSNDVSFRVRREAGRYTDKQADSQ
jgi:tetratricopeptide (TPR) repeat protein